MTDIFEGVRVVELAQYVFVPAAATLLADHGAEVIKIEPPGSGDPYRTLMIGDGRETATANLAMEQNNRGKKSVAIDLKNEKGREALLRLVDTADVFITSLRPLALKALRLEPEDLMSRNPRLIYARGNGLGFKGAEFNKAGYDASAFWARGGFADLLTAPDADVPTRPRPALGDHSSAISLLAGISSALFRRERSGKGMVVETSLLQNAAWILSSDLVYSRNNPSYDPHAGFANGHRAPLMRAYKTSDGRFIQLMLLSPDKPWPELCEMIGKAELAADPRFATNVLRIQNGAELCTILDAAFRARSWAEWAPTFLAWDAPWELIATIHELGDDPQLVAAGTIFKLPLKSGEVVDVVAGPIGFDSQCAPANLICSPELGEHSDEILAGIGFSADELAELRAAQVIG
ncbi:CaiB/BaiF CoA transferase family protein [Sphingomonas psychrolutea]|uniref:CoA transferase n=1 Tax=Sphingomonas psychrolutea TaxID=1259676 RepID=A0ABQ1G414_9SPHN|nr:CoA transferase [Sphingomonas psychrolutea]GGA37034.1 CoA transferase [Sphingomonas psychrolutea]